MFIAPAFSMVRSGLNKIKRYNANKVEIATYCAEVMEKLDEEKVACRPNDLCEAVREANLLQIRSISKDR